MTDHDRGAYTPHHDAPLSFDARYSRGRPAFPTTLVISLVILAGLAAAILMFYRSGVRSAGQPPAAVGAPVGDIKSPPPPGAQQPADAAQGLQIYKSENGAPASAPPTTFAPPPEQPQPRPAPTTPVAAQPMAPAAPAPVVAAPAPKPAPVASAPAPEPPKTVAMTPAKPAMKPASKAQPNDEIGKLLKDDASKPKAVAKTNAAPKAEATAVHSGSLVQFGAFSSTEIAAAEWAKLAKAYGPDMSGKGKLVEGVERNGKTLYRTAVSGFSSRADAAAFCAKLKAGGHDCLVK